MHNNQKKIMTNFTDFKLKNILFLKNFPVMFFSKYFGMKYFR